MAAQTVSPFPLEQMRTDRTLRRFRAGFVPREAEIRSVYSYTLFVRMRGVAGHGAPSNGIDIRTREGGESRQQSVRFTRTSAYYERPARFSVVACLVPTKDADSACWQSDQALSRYALCLKRRR